MKKQILSIVMFGMLATANVAIAMEIEKKQMPQTFLSDKQVSELRQAIVDYKKDRLRAEQEKIINRYKEQYPKDPFVKAKLNEKARFDNSVIVQEPSTKKKESSLRITGATGPVAVAISDDGKHIIAGAKGGIAKVSDINTGKQLQKFQLFKKGTITSIATQGSRVVAGINEGDRLLSQDPKAKIWDINTGKILHDLHTYNKTSAVSLITISGDKIALSDDTSLSIYNINTGKEDHFGIGNSYDKVYDKIGAIIGDIVVIGSGRNDYISIYKYDSENGFELLNTLRDDKGESTSTIAVGNNKAFIGTLYGRVKIVDIQTGKILHTLKKNSKRITSIAVDANNVLTGSKDGMAIVWDIKTGKLLHTFKVDSGSVESVAIKGNRVVVGSSDGLVQVWSL